MDSSKSPDLIGENYYALGINVASRGGKPATRPRFRLTEFTSVDGALDLAAKSPFLGATAYYDTSLSRHVLIGVYGGSLVRFDPVLLTATNLTPSDTLNFYDFCWLCQVDKYLIVQNGSDIPMIYDGTSVRRSLTGTENPDMTITSLTTDAAYASVSTGSVGSNNGITWRSVSYGSAVNYLSVEIIIPPVTGKVTLGSASYTTYKNGTLDLQLSGNALYVILATDIYGVVTTTASQLISAIQADQGISQLFTVANTGASTGAGLMTAVGQTRLTGGADATTATVTISTGHSFLTGQYIQILGAEVGTLNGEFYITKTGATTFTYPCDTTCPPTSVVTDATARWCPEVPVGTVMAAGQGRLFVASADRKTFKAGDIIYGDLNGTSGNVLRFSEEVYLAEGGDFALPAQMGSIKTMTFVPFQDSTTGQGELLVFGEYGVASFNVSLARTDWQNQQIQRVTFTEVGGVSPTGIVAANNDVIFRTQIGIRSYRQARADLSNFGQTPLSAELNRILDLDDRTLLYRTSVVNVNNRMLMTCGPAEEAWSVPVGKLERSVLELTVTTRWPHGQTALDYVTIAGSTSFNGLYRIVTVPDEYSFTVAATSDSGASELVSEAVVTGEKMGRRLYHRGLVSLDFNSLSGVGGKSSAGYDGVWTGLRILQVAGGIFNGEPRAFAFVANESGTNALWEITRETGADISGGFETPQQCVLETRSFDFQKPFTLKSLLRCDLWVTGIENTVTMTVYFRTDAHPCWTLWGTKSMCATVADPLVNEASPLSSTTVQGLPQQRSQLRFTAPPDTCDEITGRLLRMGYAAQIRIEWSGTCGLEKLLVHALEQAEQMGGDC